MNIQDLQVQELFLNDPLCKISMLFPRRTIKTVNTINQVNFEKIKHILKCNLCSYQLHNPVFLPCSHRFCKSCLSDYLRNKENANCPSCKGQLLRKRQLRYDFQLLTLVKSIKQSMQSCSTTIKSCKETWIDLQQKQLQFQPRKRIKNSSMHKNQTKFTKEYLQMQSVQIKQTIQNNNLRKKISQVSQINTKVKHIILQESISKNNNKIKVTGQKKKKTNNNQKMVSQKAAVEQNTQFDDHKYDIQQPQILSTKHQITMQLLLFTQNMLIQQFGNLYIEKLLKMNSECFAITISLQPIKKLIRIPNLQNSLYKISLNATIADIKNLINYQLNLEFESLYVEVTTQQSETELFLSNSVTMMEIIKIYCKNFSQCQYFTYSDIVYWLSDNKQEQKQPFIIYYYLKSMFKQ